MFNFLKKVFGSKQDRDIKSYAERVIQVNAGMGAQVQVYTERLSPSIYFNATQTKLAKNRFVQDIVLNKPTLVLIPKFPEYEKYIQLDLRMLISELAVKEYNYETCIYGYEIYRIKK